MNPTEYPDTQIAALARKLYTARAEARRAKKEWQDLGAKLGMCIDPGEGEYHGARCYQTPKPVEQWCPVCQQKQTAWKSYRTTGNTAAAALRNLLRATKRQCNLSSPTK